MKTVHVLGAGLGGLVAAINLAREGRRVLVIDAGREIGGIRGFHPSIHATPMDLELVARYTGVDIRSHVKALDRHFSIGLWDDLFVFGSEGYAFDTPLYGVERGSRPLALDSLLYEMAKSLGVEFSFSCFVRSADELPPGSVVATGLYPEMFDELSIPFETIEGFYFILKDTEQDGRTLFWVDEYSEDYYYAVRMNGLHYGLLFQRGQKMDYGRLLKLEKILKEREGEVHSWTPFTCRAPVKRFRQPRLFLGDHVLAGSLTGMMDPFLLFGIHGALLSGRTAALAVTDPERAIEDFKLLTHHYQRSWLVRKAVENIPPKVRKKIYQFGRKNFSDFFRRFGVYFKPLVEIVDKGIPGYPIGYLARNIKPSEKETRRAALYEKLISTTVRAAPLKNVRGAIEAIKKAA